VGIEQVWIHGGEGGVNMGVDVGVGVRVQKVCGSLNSMGIEQVWRHRGEDVVKLGARNSRSPNLRARIRRSRIPTERFAEVAYYGGGCGCGCGCVDAKSV
jgi:hypothetical protein